MKTDDGQQVQMPMDVHNGLPRPTWQVRKRAGEGIFEVSAPGDPAGQWTAITPGPEPGDGLDVATGLCAGWFLALLLALLGLATLRRRRTKGAGPP